MAAVLNSVRAFFTPQTFHIEAENPGDVVAREIGAGGSVLARRHDTGGRVLCGARRKEFRSSGSGADRGEEDPDFEGHSCGNESSEF